MPEQIPTSGTQKIYYPWVYTKFRTLPNDYKTFLYLFDNALPLKYFSGFAEPDLSERIFLSSQGIIKNIRDLLVKGTIIALDNQSEVVTMPMLAQAYDTILDDVYRTNPFIT